MTPASQMNMPMQPGMSPMMGGMNPMMGMHPMHMMGMNPMMGMHQMPMMGMNPMMGGMPMMMPMMMRMPMMARMTCEMGKDGMMCRMMPMDPGQMEMMKDCCDAMNSMMSMGMPMMMMCNGMPMMMCTAK